MKAMPGSKQDQSCAFGFLAYFHSARGIEDMNRKLLQNIKFLVEVDDFLFSLLFNWICLNIDFW